MFLDQGVGLKADRRRRTADDGVLSDERFIFVPCVAFLSLLSYLSVGVLIDFVRRSAFLMKGISSILG